MKNYNGKILKNKSLIFNCIFILAMFMITQVLGVMICLKLINTNITVTALLPGATETEFAKTSDMSNIAVFAKTSSPKVVAKDGYNAMLR